MIRNLFGLLLIVSALTGCADSGSDEKAKREADTLGNKVEDFGTKVGNEAERLADTLGNKMEKIGDSAGQKLRTLKDRVNDRLDRDRDTSNPK